jgi:hypothetical protein
VGGLSCKTGALLFIASRGRLDLRRSRTVSYEHAAVQNGELQRNQQIVLLTLRFSGKYAACLCEYATGIREDGVVVVHLLDHLGQLLVWPRRVSGDQFVPHAECVFLQQIA